MADRAPQGRLHSPASLEHLSSPEIISGTFLHGALSLSPPSLEAPPCINWNQADLPHHTHSDLTHFQRPEGRSAQGGNAGFLCGPDLPFQLLG